MAKTVFEDEQAPPADEDAQNLAPETEPARPLRFTVVVIEEPKPTGAK